VIRSQHAYLPARLLFLGASEILLATSAFLIAMVAFHGLLNTIIALSYQQGALKILLVIATIAVCMYYFDLYDPLILHSGRETFTRLVQVLASMCFIVAALYALFPSVRLNRYVFIIGTLAAGLFLLLWRELFVSTWPMFRERVLVLGSGGLAEFLLQEMRNHPELNLEVVRHIPETQPGDPSPRSFQSGDFSDELVQTVEQQRVRKIIVALGDRRGKLPFDSLLELKRQGIFIQDGHDLYETLTGKIDLSTLRPSSILFSPEFQPSRFYPMMKRVGSFLVALTILVIALPVMLLVAIAIRLDSEGPILLNQRRVGKLGRIFTVHKFRSMYRGSENAPIHRPASQQDERITRVGRWIRARRLDELPQLWNVLRGDMELVGPRPFVPNQEEDCVRAIPFYRQRWAIPPGLTGWAQVNRGYCETLADNADKLAYDLFYIKHMSLGLDMLVVVRTAKMLLSRSPA